jgi:hypothetical protein
MNMMRGKAGLCFFFVATMHFIISNQSYLNAAVGDNANCEKECQGSEIPINTG